MAETSAQRVEFVGASGPEMLRIPAEPSQLRQAAQQLAELADHLQQAGDALGQSDGRQQDRGGHTTSALMSVTRWNGGALGRDATMLRDLGSAVEEEARVLGDVQGHELPSLRRRWEQARQDFVEDVRRANERPRVAAEPAGGGQGQGQGHGGHGGGHHRVAAGSGAQEPAPHAQQLEQRPDGPHPQALMASLDEDLLRPHDDLFRELFGHGVDGGGGGGAHAFLADAEIERAIQSYRGTVRGLLDEWASHVQRVKQLERHVEEKGRRPDQGRDDEKGASASFVAMGGGAAAVSGVGVLREMVRDLRDGAQAHDHAHDRFGAVVARMRDGMLPVRDRDGDEMRREWVQHFSRRTERLRTVAARVDDVLEKFERIDAECAQAIRDH